MSYYGAPASNIGFSAYPPASGGYPSGPGYAAGNAGYNPPTVSMPEPFSGGPGLGPSYPPNGGYPGGGLPYDFHPAAPGQMQSYPPPHGAPNYPPGAPGYPASAPSYPAAAPGYPAAVPGYPAAAPGYPAAAPSYPAAAPSYPSAAPSYPSADPSGYSSTPAYPSPATQNYPAQSYPASGYPAQAAPSYPNTASYPASYQNHYSYPSSSYPHGGSVGVAPGVGAVTGAGLYPGVHAFNPSAVPSHHTPVQGQGTVRPYPNFNAELDSQVLRKAMKGLGTDEQAIISVLCSRTNEQRQRIKLQYKTLFGKDLIKDLTGELSFRFRQTILALMMSPAEYDAEQLYKAIRGLGTDEEALVEILASRSNSQIHEIKAVYKMAYKKELEKDLIGDTSGHFRRLVVSLCTGGRREDNHVDIETVRRDAMELYQAGEKKWGTDESKFNQILCARSRAHLQQVLEEYKRIASRTLEQSIRSEMSLDLQMGMLAIVNIIQNQFAYFAQRLHRCMKGAGTNDDVLIRVVVTRCEVDMQQIKQEFQRTYGQTLEAFIQDDTSGDYRRTLLALVRG